MQVTATSRSFLCLLVIFILAIASVVIIIIIIITHILSYVKWSLLSAVGAPWRPSLSADSDGCQKWRPSMSAVKKCSRHWRPSMMVRVYRPLYIRLSVQGWPCLTPCGFRGCKNGPAPFPGRMSYKATKPGLTACHILACFLLCCYLLGPLFMYCLFSLYVFCLLVVLVKLSLLAK